MAQIQIHCKAEFTKWWYVAQLFRWAGMSYPAWLKRKTIAWVRAGDKVRQIKLSEAE